MYYNFSVTLININMNIMSEGTLFIGTVLREVMWEMNYTSFLTCIA